MTGSRLWPNGEPLPDAPATSREDAKTRYLQALDWDPFPQIPEALLNSADIRDYARVTGIIYPFNSSYTKTASYEIAIGDCCTYWDNAGVRRIVDLTTGEKSFVLRKNSIVFVNTKEEFFLPHYIAVRFNLRISNVHRGILLGTGPLVDPGFAGHLLVPLHNLTTNDYVFHHGERFAWFEFTKISPHDRWKPEYRQTRRELELEGDFVPFPEDKKWLTPKQYFDKALLDVQPKTIRSSILEVILGSEQRAEKAEKNLRRLRNLVASISGIAVLTILAGTVAIVLMSWQLVSGVQVSLSEVRSSLAAFSGRVNETLPQMEGRAGVVAAQAGETARMVEQMERDRGQYNNDVSLLQRRLDGIAKEIDELRGSLEVVAKQRNAQ